MMTGLQAAYLTAWITACCVAALLVLSSPGRFDFLHGAYWRFLLRPWRLGLFGAALAGIVWLAPYSGDPTWDYVDGVFMPVLAYITAPWAVGVFYRFRISLADLKVVYVALCLWLFSASWSYDLYILLRDGFYPPTWVANLVLSSILYLAAGCLWSLTGSASGTTFVFRLPGWFREDQSLPVRGLVACALPFILLAVWVVGLVVWHCAGGIQ